MAQQFREDWAGGVCAEQSDFIPYIKYTDTEEKLASTEKYWIVTI